MARTKRDMYKTARVIKTGDYVAVSHLGQCDTGEHIYEINGDDSNMLFEGELIDFCF